MVGILVIAVSVTFSVKAAQDSKVNDLIELAGVVTEVNADVLLAAANAMNDTVFGGTTNYDSLTLSGALTTATITSTGAATLASGSVTGAWAVGGELNGFRSATTTDTVAVTLTAAQSGEVQLIKGTGATTTLPAVTNTGAIYEVQVLAAFATNNWVLASAEGDNINGTLFVNSAVVACSGEDKINFIADGEEIGDFVQVISDGTNWNIIRSRGETAAKITCTDPN